MSKKALIITPYGLFNYGNRLQNYATTRVLSHYGFESDTLVLPGVNTPSDGKEFLKKIVWSPINKSKKAKRYRSFLTFDQKISKVKYRSRENYRLSAADKYDIVVLGSDQLWNPYQLHQEEILYGKPFSSDRIVCMSPSFGVAELPENLIADAERWLKGIRVLNSRETAGSSLIERLVGGKIPTLIDPTLALTRNQWDSICDTRMVPDEPYVFIYMLGKDPNYFSQEISSFCKKLNLRPVRLMTPSNKYYAAGPQDFIGLIKNASFICTNSFHAAVFSLIYNRPFRVVERRSEGYSMGSRLESFGSLFNLEKCISDASLTQEELNGATQFEIANELLEKQKHEYYEYFNAVFAQ